MSIEMLRVPIRALLHTGDLLVEVNGTILISPRTRFSDALNAPDKMQEVVEASIVRHLGTGIQQELAAEIAVNRDRVLLVAAEAEDRSGEPGMRIELDAHWVKLLCPGFAVSGILHTPLGGSPYGLVTTGGGRFIGLTDAEVTAHDGGALPSFEGRLPFCLVNRSAVEVVIGVPEAAPSGAATA